MAIGPGGFSSSAAGTGNLTWNHVPSATPRAVLVFIIQNASETDQVTSVTYGSLTLTEVTGSPNLKTGGETGAVYAYWAGSGIPTGAQTVLVTVSGAATKRAAVYTPTAADDVELIDSDATINSTAQANPSVTLTLGTRDCFAFIGFHSGQGAVTGITPLTGWFADLEHDFGQQTAGWYGDDDVTGDKTAGWTQTSDDATAITLALSEVVAAGAATYPGWYPSSRGGWW